MSRRGPVAARGPRAKPGIGSVAPKDVDPRLTAVADWLRNEKKSGLHTKEVACRPCCLHAPRLRLKAPPLRPA